MVDNRTKDLKFIVTFLSAYCLPTDGRSVVVNRIAHSMPTTTLVMVGSREQLDREVHIGKPDKPPYLIWH